MDRNKKKISICFFGNYDPAYIRTAVVLRGLREHECKVLECNDQQRGIKGYLSLIRQHRKVRGSYDVLLVGNSGCSRTYVLLAKLLTRKPVIWDAHFSLYDAYVYDRGAVKRWSIKGSYHWFMEWLATAWADLVYLDTKAHMEYFIQLFHANPKKFFAVYVGADDTMFRPQTKRTHDTDKFIVEFHGKYIPLQGVQYIIQAAKLLETDPSITFTLIGSGQTYAENRKLAEELKVGNITFIDKVPYQEIPRYIAEADVCLGIFGDTPKTQRVIPNKLYEAVAMGKPVITARTPGIQEIFTDQENILLCNTADAQDLADKITILKRESVLQNSISEKVTQLYKNQLVPLPVTQPIFDKLITL